jgi:hypothetical protein
MCLLKYVFNCGQNFLYFDPDYPTSKGAVTGLTTVYCIYEHTNLSAFETYLLSDNVLWPQ